MTQTPDVAAGRARPWARYFAKQIDVAVFAFFVGIVIAVAGLTGRPANIIGWIALAGLFPLVEGALIARYGATPGKTLFRATVLAADGARLAPAVAVRRSYQSALFGFALFLPLVPIVTLLWGYRTYTTTLTTAWDRQAGAVFAAAPTRRSWLGFAAIVVVVFGLIATFSAMIVFAGD